MPLPWTRPQSARVTLNVYGQSGLGKSTLLADAALWIWKTYGLKSRIINADGGGTSAAFQVLADAGIASIWQVDTWSDQSIFHYLKMATMGWWPADLTTPNSELLPSWTEYRVCPKCKENCGATATKAVAKCTECSAPIPPGVTLPLKREYINGFDKVGLVGFEGMTSFGELLMNRVSEINPAGGNFVPDGDFKIAAPGQSHYGMAQKYIGGFVANSRRLPVEVVMWTALEGKGEEGKNLSGPLLPGRKLAETAGQWFNHNLHLDAIPKKDNKGLLVKDSNGMVEFERKLYLQAHYPLDSPNMMYLAKTSVPKGGEMPLVIDASMQKFFELYNLAIETSKKAILG